MWRPMDFYSLPSQKETYFSWYEEEGIPSQDWMTIDLLLNKLRSTSYAINRLQVKINTIKTRSFNHPDTINAEIRLWTKRAESYQLFYDCLYEKLRTLCPDYPHKFSFSARRQI